MIAGRVARISGLGTGVVRQFPGSSHRHLSSLARNTTNSFRSSPRGGYGLASVGSKRSSFSPITHSALGVRFASSSTPAAASVVSSVSDTDAASTFMSDPSLLNDISTIPVKMGYLKEIGLDFGWGPSSMMEMFLETFNIYGGLPWWGSAVATALLIRIAFVPLMYKANQMTLRSKAAKEVTEPLRARMVEALRTDTGKALVLKAELSAVQKSYGIQFRWVFFPLLQLPLAFGGFRVMRAMSDLPVPGLESESLLWLYDMTMPDPYYVLPAAMALVMWRTMKINQELNMGMDLSANPIAQNFMRFLPVVVAVTTSFLPGIMQLSFVTTGGLAYVQTFLMASPSFRSLVRLPALPHNPKPDPEPTAILPKSGRGVTADQNISWIDRQMDSISSSWHAMANQFKGIMGVAKDEAAKNQPAVTAKQIENRKRLAEEERNLRNLKLKQDFEKRRIQKLKQQREREDR